MEEVERFFAACQGLEPIAVEVIHRDGDNAVLTRFDKPYFVVGSAPGADLGQDDASLAPRQLYCQMIGGRLFAIQLAEDTSTLVRDDHWRAGWVAPDDVFEFQNFKLRFLNPVQDGAPPPETISPLATNRHRLDPYFTLECGHSSGQISRLDNSRPILLIGRNPPAKLRVKDRTLCSVHAAIVTLGASSWIVDLSHQRGVIVNDQHRAFAELHSGDVFYCGRTPFRFSTRQRNPQHNGPVTETGSALPFTHSTEQPLNHPHLSPYSTAPLTHPLEDDRLGTVLDQVTQVQQHSFDQFRQMLGTVMQMVGVVMQDQRQFVKDELDRMERMAMAMAQLQQANLANGHHPAATAPQIPAPPQLPVPPMPAPPMVGPGGVQLPGPTVPAPPPPGREEVILHTWIEQQLQSMQKDQETLWQKLKRNLKGDS